MIKRSLFVAVAPLMVVMAVYGQAGGPPHERGFGGPMGFGFGPHFGKVVTGAPYSATSTDVFTQTLQDGSSVQRTNTAQVARDSAGRTYVQRTVLGIPGSAAGTTPFTVISIFDPVAGYAYELHPDKKTAYRRAIHLPPADVVARSEAKRLNSDARPVNANESTVALASKPVNGVNATGVTKTVTIPVGAIGNTAQLVRTSTTWTSPDLQVVVHSVSNDPLRGQSTYDLTGIQTTEPAAALFQVPSDYVIEDGPGRGGPRGFARACRANKLRFPKAGLKIPTASAGGSFLLQLWC